MLSITSNLATQDILGGGGGGPGTLSPLAVPNLYLWYDDTSILAPSPAVLFSRAAGGRSSVLNNTSTRYVNGRLAIDYNGVNSYGLGAFALPSASDFTFFVVYNHDTTPGASRHWLLSCTDDCRLEIGSTNHRFLSANGIDLATPNPTAGEQTISVARRRGTTSLLRRFSSNSDVSLTGTAGAPVALASNTYMGIRETGLAHPLDGTISEVIVYSSGLSDSQTEGVFQYLRRKHIQLPALPVTNNIWMRLDETGLPAPGQPIDRWRDASSNNHSPVQVDINRQPVVAGSFGPFRLPGALFNASRLDLLSIAGLAIPETCTILYVYKSNAATRQAPLSDFESSPVQAGMYIDQNEPISFFYTRQFSTYVNFAGMNSLTATRLVVARHSGATTTMRANGAFAAGTPVGGGYTAPSAPELRVGSRLGNILNVDGTILELIVYNAALSDAEMISLESYAISKWGAS